MDRQWPLPGEEEKAEKALAEIPESVRDFYEIHYVIYGNPENEGAFAGLACKVCNRWSDYGHDKNCPVKRLEDEP